MLASLDDVMFASSATEHTARGDVIDRRVHCRCEKMTSNSRRRLFRHQKRGANNRDRIVVSVSILRCFSVCIELEIYSICPSLSQVEAIKISYKSDASEDQKRQNTATEKERTWTRGILAWDSSVLSSNKLDLLPFSTQLVYLVSTF